MCRKRNQNCPNDLEDEGQGHPLSIGVENNARCIFGANLVGLDEFLRSYRANGLKSAENRVKTGQMTLKMKVKVTHFQ